MEPILFLIMLIFTGMIIFNGLSNEQAVVVMIGFMMLFVFGAMLWGEGLRATNPESILVSKVGNDFNITFTEKFLNYNTDATVMLLSLLFVGAGIIGTGFSAFFVVKQRREESDRKKREKEQRFSDW